MFDVYHRRPWAADACTQRIITSDTTVHAVLGHDRFERLLVSEHCCRMGRAGIGTEFRSAAFLGEAFDLFIHTISLVRSISMAFLKHFRESDVLFCFANNNPL